MIYLRRIKVIKLGRDRTKTINWGGPGLQGPALTLYDARTYGPPRCPSLKLLS